MMKRSVEEEELSVEDKYDDYMKVTPPMHHPSRLTSTGTSAASLVATMLGGGVLSLPYALSRAGVVLGIFYLFLATALNALSIEILFACSRKSGAISYEEIAEYTFGQRAKTICKILVLLMTMGGCIGYTILIRDLSVPLFESYVFGTQIFIKYTYFNTVIGFCLVAIVSPLCFFTNLKALQFASKICMISICALICVLLVKLYMKYEVYLGSETKGSSFNNTEKVSFISFDIHDTFYSFPFMQVAFLCHFNALPVYTGLKMPTKLRIRKVIWSTVGSACVVYTIIGLAGYFFAYNHKCTAKSSTTCVDGVPDNILNAFDLNDILIDFGRFCLLATVLLSLPLLVLPARHIFVSFFIKSSNTFDSLSQTEDDSDKESLEEPLLDSVSVVYEDSDVDSPEYHKAVLNKIADRRKSLLFIVFGDSNGDSGNYKLIIHVLATIFILIVSLLLMILLPGIGFVWNITGSTIGFFLAFTIPCAFYLKLHHNSRDFKYYFAVVMLPLSLVMIVCCTYESLRTLG